jgi:TatD DNase family protein
LPEALPLPVVDNHVHLDHARSGEAAVPVEQAVAAAARVNVTRMVQIGCELESARWTVQAVDRHPALVGGVALHPTEAAELVKRGWAALDTALEEIEHIDLAKRLDLVLQIHDRDAHDDVVRILKEEGAPERTVFHCFSGDAELARQCVDAGWFLSFAGTLTFKNAGALREALALAPVELVQVETDAPYLAPMPHRGRTNAGYLVPITVRCVAEVTGRALEQVCRDLDHVAEQLYGPW